MSKSKINTERLQTFAEYLSIKEVKSAEFFSPVAHVCVDETNELEIAVNMISFMAIFELPHIFPDHWYYNNQFEPTWRKQSKSDSFTAVQKWFGLNDLQFEHLFFPGLQLCNQFGGKVINERSGKRDLAFNILELIRTSALDQTAKTNTEFRICLN